jgi:hypothetical protein
MRLFRLFAFIAAIALAAPMARTQHHFLRNVAEEFALHANATPVLANASPFPTPSSSRFLPPP